MKPHQVILILGFASSVLAYNMSDQNSELHYKLMALSYVLVLWSFHRYVETKLTKIMVEVSMWFAVSNLADELFFDPTTKEWPEYALAGGLILYSVIWYKFPKIADKLKLWRRKR